VRAENSRSGWFQPCHFGLFQQEWGSTFEALTEGSYGSGLLLSPPVPLTQERVACEFESLRVSVGSGLQHKIAC